MSARLRELIERYEPYRGPCGICDGPDARHRIFEVVTSRRRRGEPCADIAADLGLDEDLVRELGTSDRRWAAVLRTRT